MPWTPSTGSVCSPILWMIPTASHACPALMTSKPGFSKPCRYLSRAGGDVDRNAIRLTSCQVTDLSYDSRKIASKFGEKMSQSLAIQLEALQQHGCTKIFQTVASRTQAERRGLTAALDDVD